MSIYQWSGTFTGDTLDDLITQVHAEFSRFTGRPLQLGNVISCEFRQTALLKSGADDLAVWRYEADVVVGWDT